MRRVAKNVIFGSVVFALVASFWALGIELTFERNVHRGIPVDFHLYNAHRPRNWKS